MSDEFELAEDMRLYGNCFWKWVDGKRVRIPPDNVYIEPTQSENPTPDIKDPVQP